MNDLHSENYKTLRKETENIGEKIYCAHELEESISISLNCPYYSK